MIDMPTTPHPVLMEVVSTNIMMVNPTLHSLLTWYYPVVTRDPVTAGVTVVACY